MRYLQCICHIYKQLNAVEIITSWWEIGLASKWNTSKISFFASKWQTARNIFMPFFFISCRLFALSICFIFHLASFIWFIQTHYPKKTHTHTLEQRNNLTKSFFHLIQNVHAPLSSVHMFSHLFSFISLFSLTRTCFIFPFCCHRVWL